MSEAGKIKIRQSYEYMLPRKVKSETFNPADYIITKTERGCLICVEYKLKNEKSFKENKD